MPVAVSTSTPGPVFDVPITGRADDVVAAAGNVDAGAVAQRRAAAAVHADLVAQQLVVVREDQDALVRVTGNEVVLNGGAITLRGDAHADGVGKGGGAGGVGADEIEADEVAVAEADQDAAGAVAGNDVAGVGRGAANEVRA